MIIFPKTLNKGDLIGIISPSSPAAYFCPNRFNRSILELDSLGFQVKVGKHTLKKVGHLAGHIEERAQDFNEMIRNPDIK